MAFYKGQIFFSANQSAGWSETYYPAGATLDDAVNNMLLMLPLRLAMLDSESQIVYARASQEGPPRDSLVPSPFSFPSNGTYKPTAAGNIAMPPDNRVLVELFSSSTQKGRLFIGGLNSVDYTAAGQFVPGTTWFDLYQTWAAEIIADFYTQSYRTSPPNQSVIQSVEIVRGTNRKAGRPFGLYRGRRRIR